VYLYREVSTLWTVVAKFYAAKTRSKALKYAGRELRCIEQARAAGLGGERMRTPLPLGTWRGVLFLEYVDGLTLSDSIAVRQSQPGALAAGLAAVAELLARLHTGGSKPDAVPAFDAAVARAVEYVTELEGHGVLKEEPLIASALRALIEGWADQTAMTTFTPTLTHGDATTTNFLFPPDGGVVAIDWERLWVADPAADLGRLAAEVWHGVKDTGGPSTEAARLVNHMLDAYQRAQGGGADAAAAVKRARFYQASSTLRIARNGWVPRLARTALVAQAMALLVT
jgi:aminoglycoside phosphotransferase (APT) family kinase protein